MSFQGKFHSLLPPREHRGLLLFLPPLVVACLAIMIAILILLNPPGLSYTSDRYEPKEALLCPGDTLQTTIGIVVRRAPLGALRVRAWWSVERQETAHTEPGRWSVWMEPIEKAEVVTATVPNLPPGHYLFIELREQFRNSEAPAYAVPFDIPEGCAP